MPTRWRLPEEPVAQVIDTWDDDGQKCELLRPDPDRDRVLLFVGGRALNPYNSLAVLARRIEQIGQILKKGSQDA